MNVRTTIVVLSIIGCAADDPAVSADTSSGPSHQSGQEEQSTSAGPESSGPNTVSDSSGESSATPTSSTGTGTTEGSTTEGGTDDAESSSTGDASSEGSESSSTDTGGETGALDGCDPIAQNCPGGEACYPVMAEFECHGISEAGAQGDGCAFVDVCDAGLFCANPRVVENCMDDVGCCTAFCDTSNPIDPCTNISPMMFCISWYAEGAAPMGLENVGACAAL